MTPGGDSCAGYEWVYNYPSLILLLLRCFPYLYWDGIVMVIEAAVIGSIGHPLILFIFTILAKIHKRGFHIHRPRLNSMKIPFRIALTLEWGFKAGSRRYPEMMNYILLLIQVNKRKSVHVDNALRHESYYFSQ